MTISLSNISSEMIHMDRGIQGCELAVSDKAKCILCEGVIAQGTPRLWVLGDLKQAPPDEGIVKIKRFICHHCSRKIIKSKEKGYEDDIIRGEEAKTKLTKQNLIKIQYMDYLKRDDVMKKVRNDEIIKELENGGKRYGE